ncbi:MAG: hypothetical protein WDA75_02455 [Candidatus Latescibacterota bacterium]|jgi:hypothetical protein
MKKALMILLLVALVVPAASYGASARWNALGNEHRFMLDTSNYGIYPARMFMFSDALWIIPNIPAGANVPDNVMSGLLVTSGNTAYAIHYNLPGTVAFGALRNALAAPAAGANLNAIAGNLRPMPDFMVARKSGDKVWAGRLVMGLASSEPVADKTASAMSLDLAGGVQMPTSMGALDVGLRLAMASFSDESGAAKIESDGGTGVNIDARLLMDRGEGVKLIPIAGIMFQAKPTVKGGPKVSALNVNLGLGYNKGFPDKRMLVTGAVLDYTTETTKIGGASAKTNTANLAYLGGYELPLNSWLIARGGARADMTMVGGDNPAVNGTRSVFYYNFGVRTIYKKVLVDAIFDRALFHRGPYILSGSGANMAGNICLTYLFGPTK